MLNRFFDIMRVRRNAAYLLVALALSWASLTTAACRRKHSPPILPRIQMVNLGVALDSYQNDFAFYPPSQVWWQRVRGQGAWPAGWPDDWKWYDTDSPGQLPMEGAECLVYFLGGGPMFRGFSIGAKTYGPYLQLANERLCDVDADDFKELEDDFHQGRAYLYFKADRSKPGNEYDPQDNLRIVDRDGKPGEPVRDSTGAFRNPTSYQIICAGADGRYWRKTDATPSTDDITNCPTP